MSKITVTATLCPTGLFQISLFRDGEPAASQWRSVSPDALPVVVAAFARAAIDPRKPYIMALTESAPDRCTVEAVTA